MASAPGLFITFEGGEGAGKSTQIRLLREHLDALGRSCVVTREPGGSPRAERIREHILSGAAKPLGPFAEALLFYAARRDHLDTVIRPALAAGQVVLCDRFSDSTRAYQGALGALDPELIRDLDRVVVGTTRPDVTLILDVPPSLGLARAARRRQDGAGDRFEAEPPSFHERLAEAFREIAAAEPERCVLIDGTGTVEEVAERIRSALEAGLPALSGAARDVA
ncbi:MAG TPA: dTMP kinase [Beijerinckiaceae bacterium]|jgi:dTMP kinase